MNKLILITGPTSAGKTNTSIKLALFLKNQNIQSEIINFDSLLFYTELNIGTAKPKTEELQNVPHHLINIKTINEPINASVYIELALKKVFELQKNNIVPILVGGSGFYLRALLKGMYQEEPQHEMKDHDKELNQKVLKEEGISPFIEYLNQFDPDIFLSIHKNDHYRIIRAYEYHQKTGKKISAEKSRLDHNAPYDFESNIHNFDVVNFYLDIPKPLHFDYIQKRTEEMIADGLIDEVKELLSKGYSKDLKPLQSIGYKETIQYLNGDYKNTEELKTRISISTRQLAKSQRTFFNKIRPKIAINPINDFERLCSQSIDFLKSENK